MVRIPNDVTAGEGCSVPSIQRSPWDDPPPNPIRYRPCDDCDGWLMEQGHEYAHADDGPGYEQVAVRWVCTTCGRVERTDPDD